MATEIDLFGPFIIGLALLLGLIVVGVLLTCLFIYAVCRFASWKMEHRKDRPRCSERDLVS